MLYSSYKALYYFASSEPYLLLGELTIGSSSSLALLLVLTKFLSSLDILLLLLRSLEVVPLLISYIGDVLYSSSSGSRVPSRRVGSPSILVPRGFSRGLPRSSSALSLSKVTPKP